MIYWIRWSLVLPTAVLSWYGAVVITLFMHGATEIFCPPEDIISGLCQAPWFNSFSRSLLYIGPAIAACFVVLSTVFMSPSHRNIVAFVVFLGGCVIAMFMAIPMENYWGLASTITSGFITLIFVKKHFGGKVNA